MTNKMKDENINEIQIFVGADRCVCPSLNRINDKNININEIQIFVNKIKNKTSIENERGQIRRFAPTNII